MNINLWLEKTLDSIRSTDPKALMVRMERYGLIEDDVNKNKEMAHSGYEYTVCEDLPREVPFASYFFIDNASYHEESINALSVQLTFTTAPREAAFSLASRPVFYTSEIACGNSLDHIAQAA